MVVNMAIGMITPARWFKPICYFRGGGNVGDARREGRHSMARHLVCILDYGDLHPIFVDFLFYLILIKNRIYSGGIFFNSASTTCNSAYVFYCWICHGLLCAAFSIYKKKCCG